MSKTKNVYFYPFRTDINSYPLRMQDILSDSFFINDLSFKREAIKLLSIRHFRKDIAIINWLENGFLNKNGTVSYLGTIRICMILLLLKIRFKKLLYVKHNHYPHNIESKSINKIKYLMKIIVRFADFAVIHSPTEHNFTYLPHPLYKYPLKLSPSAISPDFERYIIFGRIARYKKIEDVIVAFPDNKKLIVAGGCEDKGYLSFLEGLIKDKTNITIKGCFISDADAANLIKGCNGLILSHSNEDMIVSGSFFYSLTLGVKVYALQTPFLSWVGENVGNDVIQNFKNLHEMMDTIKNEQEANGSYGEESINKINELFSDKLIKETFERLLN
ncbi:glycosyltransferase [Klebsiella grimontii]|uniref:glycosyltransferase n=2 Tax=Klebsiella grimontii TaxID=2058152 RepID=UPI0012B8E627|nr:glycosyltransferase [Klebsiella grimontii]MBZ7566177.1 glycosyltransferase [Klebsiella grimontii]MDU2467167.1 glycosyltransferase [Veillonella sp.]QXW41210.1 glycosyltransferase [Klebsiella grimontii]